jgi:glutamyl-tRNA reductase
MNRPMFLIDISVPRNIDPAVRHVDNAFLFDIDDLESRVEQNRGDRLQEAERAEHMVIEEVGTVRQWLKSLEVTPTIVALKTRVEDIKRAELEKALGRLAHLPPQERALVEAMASSIVNKLIHNTMVTLKSEVASADGAAFVEAAKRFFNLGEAGIGTEDLEIEAPTTRTSANKPG